MTAAEGSTAAALHAQRARPVESTEAFDRVLRRIGAAASLSRTAASAANAPLNGDELSGMVVLVTGASRGIGEAIAVRCASAGARVSVLAKTAKGGKNVFGTIHSAAAAVEAAGGEALAVQCDLTKEADVKRAVDETVRRFGRLDVLVNNASAIWTHGTPETDTRHYDYVTRVCQKGMFFATKHCMRYLRFSPNPHVCSVAPAPRADDAWLAPHVMYSTAKIGMGVLAHAFDRELGRTHDVAFNTVWPYFSTATAAVNMLGGEELISVSKTVAHMADPVYRVLCAPSITFSGHHLLDANVLESCGCTAEELRQYQVDPGYAGECPVDFMIREEGRLPAYADAELPAPRRHGCLAGRAAVVIGGAGVLGSAVAEALAEKGARVALLGGGGKGDELDAVAARLYDAGAPDVVVYDIPLDADAPIRESLEDFAGRSEGGAVDVLVLATSAVALTSTADTTEAVYDRLVDTWARSAFLTLREALPHLRKSDAPHVLCVNPAPVSDAGWYGPHVAFTIAAANRGMYAAGWAEEFRAEGIAVNSIWPEFCVAGYADEAFAGRERARECGLEADPGRTSTAAALGAAAARVLSCPTSFTGNFLLDHGVLARSDPEATQEEVAAAYRLEPGSAEPLAPNVWTRRVSEAPTPSYGSPSERPPPVKALLIASGEWGADAFW